MAEKKKQTEAESVATMNGILLEVIGPALIMLMVGSLVFFLIEVFYRGPHATRLCWVYGLLTFAAVLVSRVSITSGQERGVLFGFALGFSAFLTSMALIQFDGHYEMVLKPFILLGFILVVMWSSSKLTWDCTVIDSSRDSSAIGITELVARKVRGEDVANDKSGNGCDNKSKPNPMSTPTDSSESVDKESTSDAQAGNLIKAFFQGKRKRKNTPGIWVFYFSMAALPIFGFGQWFVRPDQSGGFGWIVFLFGIYLAAGLALMMTTSLLGLQRYLQKRKARLPAEIARAWMSVGAAIAIGVMLVVMLLPRPNIQSGVTNGLKWFSSPPGKATDGALGDDGTEEKESGNSSKSGEDGKQSDSNADTDSTSGSSKDGEKTTGGGKSKGDNKSDSSSKKQDSQGKQKDGKQENQKGENSEGSKSEGSESSDQDSQNSDVQTKVPDSQRPDLDAKKKAEQDRKKQEGNAKKEAENKENGNQSKSNSNNNSGGGGSSASTPKPPSLANLQAMTSLVVYTLAFIAAAILAFIMRKEVAAAFRGLLETLRNLFGAKKSKTAESDEGAVGNLPSKELPPFSQYLNPFHNSKIDQSPERIVEYSFQALEAWARDNGLGRPEDKTAHEFAKAIKKANPEMGVAAAKLANLHCKLLFGNRKISADEIAPLKQLWQLMENASQASSPPAAVAPA